MNPYKFALIIVLLLPLPYLLVNPIDFFDTSNEGPRIPFSIPLLLPFYHWGIPWIIIPLALFYFLIFVIIGGTIMRKKYTLEVIFILVAILVLIDGLAAVWDSLAERATIIESCKRMNRLEYCLQGDPVNHFPPEVTPGFQLALMLLGTAGIATLLGIAYSAAIINLAAVKGNMPQQGIPFIRFRKAKNLNNAPIKS